MNKKTLPVFLIFISMGMIDSAGPGVSLARGSFKISNAMASLLPMSAYITYGTTIQTAFMVPFICISYLIFVAILNNKKAVLK